MDADADGVGERDRDDVKEAEAPSVKEAVGVTLGVGDTDVVGDELGVALGVGECEELGVGVADRVGVAAGDRDGLGVAVGLATSSGTVSATVWWFPFMVATTTAQKVTAPVPAGGAVQVPVMVVGGTPGGDACVKPAQPPCRREPEPAPNTPAIGSKTLATAVPAQHPAAKPRKGEAPLSEIV